MLWIQLRVDYITNLPQILSRTTQQQQAQPSLQHPSKGLDSSKLEHYLFQQSPPFDEDKSLVLVFDLIESEAVPAKLAYIQSDACYSSRLDFHTIKV